MIDTATIVSFDQPEEVSEIEEPAVQASVEEEKFEDFNNLEASSIINDMPQASSLFKAIINKMKTSMLMLSSTAFCLPRKTASPPKLL